MCIENVLCGLLLSFLFCAYDGKVNIDSHRIAHTHTQAHKLHTYIEK